MSLDDIEGSTPPKDLQALYGNDMLIMSFELPGSSRQDSLTSVEVEVLIGVLAGRSNADIARDRRRSVRTVVNQVSSILRKLGVKSRLSFVARMPRFG